LIHLQKLVPTFVDPKACGNEVGVHTILDENYSAPLGPEEYGTNDSHP
jgi:hypothetical protein